MTSEETALAVSAGRRHIIKRPRLTRLLDEAAARIILLIAPAGYGKTTLAREWLENCMNTWYRGTPAAADVAALAVGLAEAASAIVPGAGRRMRERLKVTEAPEREADVLAELLAEDLTEWPDEAWLTFDDYHFAMESEAAERFVDHVATLAPIRLLIGSRQRPTWATARRVLYGELYELGRNALSMTADEAKDVLTRRNVRTVPGLVALAEGWPAVIGLAALTQDSGLPESELPLALFEYFAEELFVASTQATQLGITKLSLMLSLDTEVAHEVLGEKAPSILDEAMEIGFLTRDGNRLELHPLLRKFLIEKFGTQPQASTKPLLEELGTLLLSRKRWDDLFELLGRFPNDSLLISLLREGAPAALSAGRVGTVTRWLVLARNRNLDSPVAEVIEGEVSLRNGFCVDAEALAHHASVRLTESDPFHTQALLLGGTSAHLADRYDVAAGYFRQARAAATTTDDASSALWGLFVASHYLEDPDASSILAELQATAPDTQTTSLRLASAKFHDACRVGTNLRSALDVMRSAATLAPRAGDPHVASSFLQSYAHALMLTGSYRESFEVSTDALELADSHRIRFVRPIAHCVQAFASIGLRNFGRASLLIDSVDAEAHQLSDLYNSVNASTARARLFLARGDHRGAVDATERSWDRALSPGGPR